MLAIPLYFFLFAFFLGLLVIAIFAISNLYHIFTTASFTMASFVMTCFVFGAMALILFIAGDMLQDVTWTREVVLFKAEWIQGILQPGAEFK